MSELLQRLDRAENKVVYLTSQRKAALVAMKRWHKRHDHLVTGILELIAISDAMSTTDWSGWVSVASLRELLDTNPGIGIKTPTGAKRKYKK